MDEVYHLRRVLANTIVEIGRVKTQRDELADLLTAYTNEIAREDFKWSTLNEIAADARAALAKLF